MLTSLFLQIDWDNRYRRDRGRTCLVTVDGTDMAIFEPGIQPHQRRRWRDKKGRWLTCHPKWYSHKHKGPGVRYEIAVCIQTGDIVWLYGPFPCGKWPDKKIFEHRMIHRLDENEMIEADRGYKGMGEVCRMPGDYLSQSDNKAKANARARHETINRRLKQFGVLGKRFRHPLRRHKVCCLAAGVCTQLLIEHGEIPFQCRY